MNNSPDQNLLCGKRRAQWAGPAAGRLFGFIAITGIAALAAACSSPPATRFHSLLMPPAAFDAPPADSPSAVAAAPLLYEFTAVTVPQQVDQPQLVVRNVDDTMYKLEQERWAGPLADEFRAAVSERLARRFKAQQARHLLPDQRPSERLRIDVLRFESMPGREVRLEAAWSLRTLADNAIGLSCRSEIRQSIGPGYEAIAAGHRAAVALLADEIGPAMQGLQNGQATCR
jgi:uncharacterized lipoprotein YmbA